MLAHRRLSAPGGDRSAALLYAKSSAFCEQPLDGRERQAASKTISILVKGRMRSAPERSLLSTRPRRGAWHGRTLPALMLALASAIAGCATSGPRPAATVASKEPYLLLRLSERRLYVKDDDVVPPHEGFPVAIGKPQYPTPTGRFQVVELVKDPDFLVFDFSNPSRRDRGRIPPGPNNPLGLRWIAFTEAHGWAVGFHGTKGTHVLGQAVSHGCVRMSNPDIVRVYDRIKLGTPVIVEP
jgi:L,D-transpeptidase ErfK/SrfK